MNTKEIKELLAQKLHDEGTYFTKSDIKMTKVKNGYKIIIKDYEHIPFILKTEQDEYFGFLTTIYRDDEETYIYFDDSKREYDLFHAILYLGYYIGSRF